MPIFFTYGKSTPIKRGQLPEESSWDILVRLSSSGYFNDVVTKLSFNRALHISDFTVEASRFEFSNHLTFAKCAQASAVTAGRAAGVFLSDCGKISAAFDFVDQGLALAFAIDQDVASSCLTHVFGFQMPKASC
jgi:hypothetical protein